MAKTMGKKRKKVEVEYQTEFERQEETWLENECQGNIEDY